MLSTEKIPLAITELIKNPEGPGGILAAALGAVMPLLLAEMPDDPRQLDAWVDNFSDYVRTLKSDPDHLADWLEHNTAKAGYLAAAGEADA